MSFAPTISQIADPEAGSFQHKAHVGIDEKGNVVAEGEVERKWTDFLGGPVRSKVSLFSLTYSMFGVDRSVSQLASTISDRAWFEEVQEIPTGLISMPTLLPYPIPLSTSAPSG